MTIVQAEVAHCFSAQDENNGVQEQVWGRSRHLGGRLPQVSDHGGQYSDHDREDGDHDVGDHDHGVGDYTTKYGLTSTSWVNERSLVFLSFKLDLQWKCCRLSTLPQ